MRTSNQLATLDEARAEFDASWKQWKAWAGLEETEMKCAPSLTEEARRILQEYTSPPKPRTG